MKTKHEGLSAWWAVREVDHLFGRLGRYTRFVVYSKWSLLAITLILTVSLIAWPLLTKDHSGVRISFIDKNITGETVESPVMKNPDYSSVSEDGERYKVIGKTAIQKTPTLVVIDAVEAQLTKSDGSWFSLTADLAEYHQDTKKIDLFGNVSVIDDQVTNFITEEATIEIATSHVVGRKPITGTGAFGNILASGFEIKDKGNHIIFRRGDAPVKVIFERDSKKKK